jgi:thymidine phosphorylase
MHTDEAGRFDRALEAVDGAYRIADAGTPLETGGPLIAGRVG